MGRGAQIKLGRGTRICRHSMVVMLDRSRLEVGDDTIIGHYANVRSGSLVRIGSHVRLGQFVSIIGDNHRYDRTDIPIAQQGLIPADVVIGDDVWIGTQAVILPGVTIGSGAIVGAGSIVTRDVPAGAITAGNPARVLRNRGDPESGVGATNSASSLAPSGAPPLPPSGA